MLKQIYPARPTDAHKGDFGHILFLCGCGEESIRQQGGALITGAPYLALLGAYRTGAGLCTLLAPAAVVQTVAARLAEPLFRVLPEQLSATVTAVRQLGAAYDVTVCGCGLGKGAGAKAALTALITGGLPRRCLVLDADGLNLLSDAMKNERDTALGQFLLQKTGVPRVLTPHPLELVRLLCGAGVSVDVAAIRADREGFAKRAAALFAATVVLKGAGTVIASPDGRVTVNSSGTPAMAKGGSGDVLAGMIGAALAGPQGGNIHEAVAAAVYLHGLAGELLCQRHGEYGVLPSELPEAAATVLRRELQR